MKVFEYVGYDAIIAQFSIVPPLGSVEVHGSIWKFSPLLSYFHTPSTLALEQGN